MLPITALVPTLHFENNQRINYINWNQSEKGMEMEMKETKNSHRKMKTRHDKTKQRLLECNFVFFSSHFVPWSMLRINLWPRYGLTVLHSVRIFYIFLFGFGVERINWLGTYGDRVINWHDKNFHWFNLSERHRTSMFLLYHSHWLRSLIMCTKEEDCRGFSGLIYGKLPVKSS